MNKETVLPVISNPSFPGWTRPQIAATQRDADWERVKPLVEATYAAGVAEGLRMYAWWKDGVQYVGTSGTTLTAALAQLEARKEAP